MLTRMVTLCRITLISLTRITVDSNITVYLFR